MIGFLRAIKFGLQGFWRNIWLSLITISIFVLTLVIVNTLFTLNILGTTAIQSVEDRIDVSVSFVPEATEETVLATRGFLLGLSQVKDVEYVTAEEVLSDFMEENANQDGVLDSIEEIGENPFGSQLVVQAVDPSDFSFILEALESPEYAPYIEDKDFQDHEFIISQINQAIERLRFGGIIIGGIFAIISILIVFNTIRVAIYTHREEIGIMRLVGASSWFIRAPFYFEIFLYSLLSMVVMGGVLYPILTFLEPKVNSFFDGVDVPLVASFFGSDWYLVFGLQFLGLFILGVIAATFAMQRYLRR